MSELKEHQRKIINKLTGRDSDVTNHHYDINLSPEGDMYVKRDGVDWPEVKDVQTNLVDDRCGSLKPVLTFECFAEIDNLYKPICDPQYLEGVYHLEINPDPLSHSLKVYRNGVYLDEVSHVEVVFDTNSLVDFIRLTVTADVDIHWEYKHNAQTADEQD